MSNAKDPISSTAEGHLGTSAGQYPATGRADSFAGHTAKRIALVSLGCPKNQVDSECMAGLIEAAGYRLTPQSELADAIVVNTCGFIQAAKEEAIAAILDAAEQKQAGTCRYLVVCGCLAQRYAEDIRLDLPEVDAILGISHYQDIVPTLDQLFASESQTPVPLVLTDYERCATIAHLGGPRRLAQEHFAYLKLSEGCRHRCSYCAIPLIRGALVSRPFEDLVLEAEGLRRQAVKELILVAQDTTAYGLDLYGKRRLAELLEALSALGFERIRFLYAYADGLTDELLATMARLPNVLHYIDLPIQHASDSVLRRMRRADTKEILRERIGRIRQYLPDVVLRTTVMVAFPAESEAEFSELLDFIKEIRFDHLGCFIFSAEEGTAAAEIPGLISDKEAKKRYNTVMSLQQDLLEARHAALIGREFRVLLEGVSEDGLFYTGRAEAQAPEIDTLTYALFECFEPRLGEIYPVRVLEIKDRDWIGVCRCESPE